jgi:hypothetical protein
VLTPSHGGIVCFFYWDLKIKYFLHDWSGKCLRIWIFYDISMEYSYVFFLIFRKMIHLQIFPNQR